MAGRLLERDDELARIARLVDSARDSGNLILVEGAAGIGKTGLLEEARRRAAAAGLLVLKARGVALEAPFAFGVVRQLFEGVVAELPEAERRQILSGPAALVGPLIGHAGERQLRPVADSIFASLHGLYWLTFNLAKRRPLLIALDDAHWADVASLRFVHFLAARLEGMPVAIVVALRPGEAAQGDGALESLRSDPAAQVLAPAELSERACERLIQDELGGGAEPAFCRACAEATGGNPFYLRALIDGLRRDRLAPTASSARRIAAQVPATVVRALMLRLSQLPPASVRLAQALAVLGADAELRDAAALAGLALDEAEESADRLAGAGILARSRPLRFMHPIVDAAVSADLPDGQRSRMHARSARLLGARGAPAERIASHLLAGEPSGERWSVEILRAAAADALARGAPDSAVRYLARARREGPPAELAAAVSHELGAAEFLAGDEAAIEHLRDALALSADVHERARIAVPLAVALTTSDRFQETVAVLERAIAELDGRDPDLARTLQAQLLGAAALHLSTRPTLGEHLSRLRPDELGDTPSERQLIANVALFSSSEGERADVAAGLCERALAGGKLLEEVTSDSQIYFAAANALLYCEDFDRARYWYDRGLEDARARGSLFGFALTSAMRAECHLRTGELAEAEADALAAIDAGAGKHFVLAPVAVGTLAQVMVERGQFAEADTLLCAWRLPSGLDQPGMTNWLPYARGQLQLATGAWAAAAESFWTVGTWMRAWGERDPGLLDWRTGAALALSRAGGRDRARELNREQVALARSLRKRRALGIGLHAAGVIEGGAIEPLRAAVAELSGASARLEHARALIDLGAALRRANHRKEARMPLREGVELAWRAGATVLADRGHAELVAAGARPRRAAVRGLEALTPSERRVARLAADGLSTPEVAQQLFITVNTVETHLRRAYLKLGIHARDELPAALALPATGSPGPVPRAVAG
jgi:DNA-binding CsgD family transcriptional regulator